MVDLSVSPFLKVTQSQFFHGLEVPPELGSFIEEKRRFLKAEFSAFSGRYEEIDRAKEAFWDVRSFPVLSILAPAVVSDEGKIEYPGDPVCLYAGISKMVSEVVWAHDNPFSEEDGYHDYCPQLGILPNLVYRNAQTSSTKRNIKCEWNRLNTDQTVFDPRAWNCEIKAELITLLEKLRPAVVLISSVSCAHRYALDICRTVKSILPSAITILGGRHADETVQYDSQNDLVTFSYSSTVRTIYEMRTDRNVDFVVSKDGAYCLDFLIKAISLAYDPANTFVDQTLLEQAFNYQAVKHEQTRGKSTIIWICRDKPRAILFQGPRYYLSDIPHVYSAFAIRAHFPIFADSNGRVLRTAHVLTTDACPYKCAFCSEGIGVLGRLNKLSKSPVETQIVRLKQLADFGAEAIFFDDSVMFGGNLTNIRDFSKALISLKDDIQTLGSDSDSFLDITTQRGALNLLNLQWGAQLTGEFFSTLQTPDQAKELLSLMGRSGCTYIYFGIESLAESLIAKIHKHRRQALSGSWHSKIRQSLSLVKSAGIQVGSSVLFGLDGETRETINETILGVANLINDGLLDLASPNIMTYHPGTEITRLHQMENKLDYHSAEHDVRPPYSYFEQAFPGVVSNQLNEDDIWYIHRQATLLWGSKRNSNQTNKYFEVEDEDVRPRHHGVNANK